MRYSQDGYVSIFGRSIYIRHNIGGRGDTAEPGISLPEAFASLPAPLLQFSFWCFLPPPWG